jgi:hypothetical protein
MPSKSEAVSILEIKPHCWAESLDSGCVGPEFQRRMKQELSMAAAKTFWTSFLGGLTGEGIFGDLRIPGSPIRLFKEEPSELAVKAATQRPGEIANSLGEHNVFIAGIGKGSPRFYGSGQTYDEDVAVAGVNVDVDGEMVNIKRDREKGWVIVLPESTTRAARS